MVAEHLEPKYEAQTAELYRSLGMFVVRFEHLVFAMKNRILTLCDFGQETALLLEPYTARQSIEILDDLIRQRTEAVPIGDEDRALFKLLIADLRSMNAERNRVVHTTWYIGWASDKDTDFSKAHGHKFSSQINFKAHEVSPATFESLIQRSDSLYSVMFTMWPIEIVEQLRGPPLSELFSRSAQGLWARQ